MTTEKQLIDAGELKEKLWFLFKWFGQLPCNESDKITQQAIKRCIGEVDKIPTIDAVEVVHGRNLKEEWPSLFECSVCGCNSIDTYSFEPSVISYCPNCGAKMDGGADRGNL